LRTATGIEVPWHDADVTKAGDVDALAAWLDNELDRLDILVVACGGSRRALFEELDDAAWMQITSSTCWVSCASCARGTAAPAQVEAGAS